MFSLVSAILQAEDRQGGLAQKAGAEYGQEEEVCSNEVLIFLHFLGRCTLRMGSRGGRVQLGPALPWI